MKDMQEIGNDGKLIQDKISTILSTRCDICADNFHGDPELPTGSCKPCDCSSNWNSLDTGNCDPHTGQCLKCLFDTEGFNCERCVEGFFGDAINDHCRECTCNVLGTDPNR